MIEINYVPPFLQLIVFHYPGQEQPRLPPKILPRGRQKYGSKKRPDHYPSRSRNIPGISGSSSAHQLFRFRKPQPSRFSHKQFFSSAADDRSALQISMAGGTIFQMDQAELAHQVLFRYITECGENPNLDCHKRLRACGHREKRTQARTKPQRNFANPQHYIIRKKPHLSGVFRIPLQIEFGAYL